MKTFKQACRQHFESQSLSEKQLNALMELQGKAEEKTHNLNDNHKSKQQTIAFRLRHQMAFAASILVVICWSWFQYSTTTSLESNIAKEIAYNHAKRMQLDVLSSESIEIGHYLSRLDFSLISPSFMQSSDWQLMGGRYCSIQGKLAAQLRVHNTNSDNYHTYYQSRIPEGLVLEGGRYSQWVDGYYVEMWIENDLLHGMAGEIMH